MADAKEKMPYAVFLSYAGEEADLAREIARALKARHIPTWYAGTELKVGESLLASINRGLTESERGLLVISKAYLSKGWPSYEMETLMRQKIETGKRLLPLWHDVTKEDVERVNVGLAGIYALNTDLGLDLLIQRLEEVLIPEAVTLAQTSSWENPMHRFLRGEGEATLLTGGTFTLWEALLDFQADKFPIRIDDRTLTRDDLVLYAYDNLIGDLTDIQMTLLSQLDYRKILDILQEEGADLSLIAYQELP